MQRNKNVRRSVNQGRSNTSLRCLATMMAMLIAASPAQAQTPAPAPAAPAAAPAPAAPAPATPAPAGPNASRGVEGPDAVVAPEPAPPAEPAPPVDPVDVAAPPVPPTPAEPPPPAEPPAPPVSVVGPPLPPSAPLVQDGARGEQLRRAGGGTMIAGGVVAAIGFGLAIGFTLKSKSLRRDGYALAEESERLDCSRMVDVSSECKALSGRITDTADQGNRANRNSVIGGLALAGGVAIVAIGGILYNVGVRKLRPVNSARLRVSPAWGGLVLSGRF